jgi:Ca2+-binding EF-hand superfamily protein
LEDLFKTIDANNDGFINFDEFFRIMNKFNPNVSLKEVNSLFNKIDKDENGMISFEGNLQITQLNFYHFINLINFLF